MSRNGVGRTTPPFITRMRPACSTMKRRPEPSPAFVTSMGLSRPAATRVSLNDPLLTVPDVGDGSGGMELADGDGVGLTIAGGEGVGTCDVVCWAQPAVKATATQTAISRARQGYAMAC